MKVKIYTIMSVNVIRRIFKNDLINLTRNLLEILLLRSEEVPKKEQACFMITTSYSYY